MATHNTKVTFKTIKSDINKSDSAIREAIANAIDAESKNIYIYIYEKHDEGSLLPHNYFCIDIADDGLGIPIEKERFEEVFCQYKVSTKNEKTSYGKKGKGRYTYLTLTKNPEGVFIYTKQKNTWFLIKFQANESDNIKITNNKYSNNIKTPIKNNFTTLVQFKDVDISKFEVSSENVIDSLFEFVKAEIISFFADRIASKSVKIYLNGTLLRIDDYLERKIIKEKIEVNYDNEIIQFDVDFYIWNDQIKLKSDRQKHILFLNTNNTLRGIAPSGKNRLSIANQKQNHTIIVKSRYFNGIDYINIDDKYSNLLTDKVIENLRKQIAIRLEYILFEIYKSHLDKVAEDYLQYLNVSKDEITTQVYHSIMYPFVEKFGNKKVHSDIKNIIVKLIDTLLKESPDSYLRNLQTILNLPLKDSEKLLYIEENYGIVRAIAQKEKLIGRIDILNNFDEMVNGKGRKKIKERTMLHHVIDKNLWIIDERFEEISYNDIYSDVSLKTILESNDMYSFDSEELKKITQEYNLKKVPDIFIPIDLDKIIYIIELKKPNVKISQKIINEIMNKYTKTIKEINGKLPENTRKKLYAIAISDKKTENVYTVGDLEKDGVKIEPFTWKEVIDKTRERYKKKVSDLDFKIKHSKWVDIEDFILFHKKEEK